MTVFAGPDMGDLNLKRQQHGPPFDDPLVQVVVPQGMPADTFLNGDVHLLSFSVFVR